MIEYETEGRIATIRINRPDKRNAIDGPTTRGIEEAIDRIEGDPDVWVAVLAGEGAVFCAGADLRTISEGRMDELVTERGGFAGIATRERSKPIIAAVDGPALAGGTEVVLSCDLIVASTAASFGIPEVKRALVAGAGGLFRLPRVLPDNIALELAMTGGSLSAERAHHFGMVNQLCEPGTALSTALALAGEIAQNAPLAVQESRRQVIGLRLADDAAGFAAGVRAMTELSATEDFAEGPRAFLEKRAPVWKGQ